ncbi:uncharacterized protein At3g27210-like [Cornus florida]|uniref:uncharacterized protein At3g27210-like n=1 Tax=Cornus florida TaxID=4283 RepID=UPI0028970329|nr:uncharacterized protein At3g27210-like [Cornus florida]
MGACVSVHKDSDSIMKLRLSFGSKTEKLVVPSPIKDKPIISVDRPVAGVGLKSQWSPSNQVTSFDLGSKDETFFDSQAWLESDCEDDFLSVNGDFTPSRGSTPVHHNFSTGTPLVNRALLQDRAPGSIPEPSPTEKKKKLSELFRDSFGGDQDVDSRHMLINQNEVNVKREGTVATLDLSQKSANGTPYVSGSNSVCSSERTPNGDFRREKEKSIRSTQCCLPRLLSSSSFSERKKNLPPPSSVK